MLPKLFAGLPRQAHAGLPGRRASCVVGPLKPVATVIQAFPQLDNSAFPQLPDASLNDRLRSLQVRKWKKHVLFYLVLFWYVLLALGGMLLF